jgi:hypothetical protein
MNQTLTNTPERSDQNAVAVVLPDQDPTGNRTGTALRTTGVSDQVSDPAAVSDRTAGPIGPAATGPIESGPHGSGPDDDRTKPDRTGPRHAATKIKAGPVESGPKAEPDRTSRTERTAASAAASASALRAWVIKGGYLNLLTAIVALIASLGQRDFAIAKGFVAKITIGAFDLSPWLAPLVFDVAVAALLHGGLYWARKRHSPWPWWIAAAGVAAVSIYTNTLHDAWQITAPASAVLFLIWFLRLFFDYRQIQRDREIDDERGTEFRKTDFLFQVNKPLAQRAWLLAREKPLDAGLRHRHSLGDIDLTKRDLAIVIGRRFNMIYEDRLYLLTHPTAPAAAAPAGSETDGKAKAKAKKPGKVRWYHRARLADARRRAALVAEDEVDRFLGLRVIERTGIVVDEVTYKEADYTALISKAPERPEPQPEPEQRRITSSSGNRRRELPAGTNAKQPAAPTPDARPAGLGRGADNWMLYSQIGRLPDVGKDVACGCPGPKQGVPCQWTLREHVERRGTQVKAVIERITDWATRPEHIKKDDVDIPSSGGATCVASLLNQLRAVAAPQYRVLTAVPEPEGETAA